MPNLKKLIITAVVLIVLVAAMLTVLGSQTLNPRSIMLKDFGSGIASVPPMGVSESAPMGIPAPAPDIMMRNEAIMPEFQEDDALESIDQPIAEKKVIKNGNLDLRVESADEAANEISQIARDNGGEVFSSNFYESPKNVKSGSITVKVPVANFDKTFNELKAVATLVVRESTSGQDVTEQYTDLQSRLRNKQAEEAQYVKILEQAEKIQDILDVTRQLSRVRGEIEVLQGQIKFLESQTDMASIFINLTEDADIAATPAWRPWQVIKDSVNLLIKKGQGFVNFAIVLIVTVIPVAFLYLLLAYVIYRIGRRIYFRIKERNKPPSV